MSCHCLSNLNYENAQIWGGGVKRCFWIKYSILKFYQITPDSYSLCAAKMAYGIQLSDM